METVKSHIGMIVQSTTLDSEEKVKAVYGGSKWQKIEGRFLLGASSSYKVNSTGGNANHNHQQSIGFDGNSIYTWSNDSGEPIHGSAVTEGVAGITDITKKKQTSTLRVAYTSGASSLPPYKTVYIWERTA